MKALLALCLATASPLAMAAVDASARGLVDIAVFLIIFAVVVGILLWLVKKAPFIEPEFKEIIKYVIYFICALILINWLLGFTSSGSYIRFR